MIGQLGKFSWSRSKRAKGGPLVDKRGFVETIGSDEVPSKPFEGFVARPENFELNLVNAWALAHASNLAYMEQDKVEATAAEWGLKGVTCYGYGGEGPDTQCFVAAGDTFIVVAFRGTEVTSMRDWLRDLRFWQDASGPLGCKVHSGFLRGLTDKWKGKPIIDSIIETIKRMQKDYGGERQLAIYLTGHSLGAALATLATAFLLEDDDLKENVVGQYTFGSPRVSTPRFRRRLHATASGGERVAHRFQNREDIVTRIPAWWRAFSHVGRWWYMKGNEQELVLNPTLWTRLADMWSVTWDFVPDFLYDHKLTDKKPGSEKETPGGYIEGLEKNLKRGIVSSKQLKVDV